MKSSCLGPEYSDDQILQYLNVNNIPYEKLSPDEMPAGIADLIASEKTIGWFQGRMEFGPRALGARSIIGDARSPKMQEIMNLKIKFRESFRPFAPSVLRERAADFFDIDSESPYMLIVAPVKETIRRVMTRQEQEYFGLDKLHVVRSSIPAVTHVDYSARVQTVTRESNPVYYEMIASFSEKYGCSVIINTSFNVRGEPIVCMPEDAFLCFMRTNMDYLVMGNYLLNKEKQKPLNEDINWQKKYEND